MHAWFSSRPSAPSVWHWMVEFILIKFCRKVLPYFQMLLTAIIEYEALHLLKCVGYATVKNQSEQDALLPLKCHRKNCSKQMRTCKPRTIFDDVPRLISMLVACTS
jgi:hypothetical protein